jgi:hypothetical protein
MNSPLTDGLIAEDGSYIYPIASEIILLLTDLALLQIKRKFWGAALMKIKN